MNKLKKLKKKKQYKENIYILLNKEEQTNVRNSYIRDAVSNNDLIKLKSIFYGMDSYHFD